VRDHPHFEQERAAQMAAPERLADVLRLAIEIGAVDGTTLEGLGDLATDPPMTPELHAELVAYAVKAGLVRAEDVVPIGGTDGPVAHAREAGDPT
jgi:hypothetical protein